ncbi:MAG: AI-2E family transporter [Chloroflexi bacterium]|nr:AI-2E family transporter [Chloroflexota bacterium]MDA8187222.1 AI-2E family transporter [Dehalococcoidales bacterium]
MDRGPIRIAPETIFLAVGTFVGAYLFLSFISTIRFVIVIFLVAVIVAKAIEPLVRIIEGLRIRRGIAIVIAYLIILQVLLLLGALVVPPLVVQIEMLVLGLPDYLRRLQEILAAYGLMPVIAPSELSQALGTLATNLAGFLPSILLLPLQVTGVLIALAMMFVISFYWLLISKDVAEYTLQLLPAERRREWEQVLTDMGDRIGGWVRGQIILSTAIGALVYIGLALLNVQFALALAVFAAITELVPMVGPVIGAIPAVLIALLNSPLQATLVVILYVLIHQLEGNVLAPNVMHREVGLHPLLVILALLVGAELMGIIGALLAIPLAAAFQVLVAYLVRGPARK